MDEACDSPGVIAPPPLIVLAALLLALALDWFFPSFILRGILGFGTRLIIGAILIATGAGIAILARSNFLQAGTNIEPWKPFLTVVTGGIFARMRNPMYVGLMLFFAGIAVALESGWMLILLVPMAAMLHFGVVKREERYLGAKFGETYRAYLNSVARYGLPTIRH